MYVCIYRYIYVAATATRHVCTMKVKFICGIRETYDICIYIHTHYTTHMIYIHECTFYDCIIC